MEKAVFFDAQTYRAFQCLYYIKKRRKKPSSKLNKYLHQSGKVYCVLWIKMYQMRHKNRKNAGKEEGNAAVDAKIAALPAGDTL